MSEAATTETIENQPRENGTFFQYAKDLHKHFWKDHVLQVRWNAISRGFLMMWQAALALLPLPVGTLSMAGCIGLASILGGIGTLALAYSIPKTWASLEGLF